MMEQINKKDLSKEQIKLFALAVKARENAYSPYSGFKVGAALRSSTGATYSGCNVESVDFTLSSHAEMVAIDQMILEGGREISEILVCMETEQLPVPCGLCRQKMLEFKGESDISIICVNIDKDSKVKEIIKTNLSELLPYSFDKSTLLKNKLGNPNESQ